MLNQSEVAATWIDRSRPSPKAERLLTEAFWRLLAGCPVPVADLGTALDLPLDAVEDLLTALAAGRCLRRDATGAVVAARGLMVAPSPHRLVTARGSVYTQCTIDAIGIPAGLGLEAVIEDRCADCETCVNAVVTPFGRVTVDPAPAVIVMARCDSWDEDGIPTVCRETNFFCSKEHASRWRDERASLPGALVSPARAATIGRAIWGQFAREEC